MKLRLLQLHTMMYILLHNGWILTPPLRIPQSGIRLATTLSLALHFLYLSLPLRYSYSVRHLGLVGSHDRTLSVSASGVFDILALYKLDYYYYYYYY